MNQKQRQYIIKELTASYELKRQTIEEVANKTSYNAIAEEICKAVKSGDIKYKEWNNENTYNSIHYFLPPSKLILLIKRSVATINSQGCFILKVNRLYKAILELGSGAWDFSKVYNPKTTLKYFIETLKSQVENPLDIDAIEAKYDTVTSRKEKLAKAFKDAERKAMLSNNEELIKAIEDFENMEF